MLLIPIANICQWTLFAAWRTPDTDLLAVAQHVDVEIKKHRRIRRQQGQQQWVSGCRIYFGADQPQPLTDPMNVGVNGQDRLRETEKKYLSRVPV